MAKNGTFEVFISGGSTSVDDYRRAMTAPKSDLPALTDQQRFVAKKMGLSEEEYRRGVLADRFGDSRMLSRGKKLGDVIQGLLDEMGSEYEVEAIQAEMVKMRWVARLANPDHEVVAEIPRDLADDVLDSGASRELARLKACLVHSLNRGELAAKD